MKSIWDLSKYKHYCGFRIALANADSWNMTDAKGMLWLWK
jgi:hypothetical protein